MSEIPDETPVESSPPVDSSPPIEAQPEAPTAERKSVSAEATPQAAEGQPDVPENVPPPIEAPVEAAPAEAPPPESEKPDKEGEAVEPDVTQDDGVELGALPVEKPEEDDDGPIQSVSFAEVIVKDSKEQQGATKKERGSIASVMSYDSVASADIKLEKGKGVLGSIISIRRGSMAGGEYFDRHRVAKYMNSYKLEPDKPFHVEKVEKLMREILTEALENCSYDPDKTAKQAKWASSAMRAKLKEQEYDRCKLICLVTMGEKRSQDVTSIFRFLWDPDRDKFAHVVHENMSVFAVAVCFGIYYE